MSLKVLNFLHTTNRFQTDMELKEAAGKDQSV